MDGIDHRIDIFVPAVNAEFMRGHRTKEARESAWQKDR
jgi:hypothetical protein